MQIKILSLLEGAKNARGLTIVIDVFRAFSTSAYAFDNGTKRIVILHNIEKALAYREKQKESLLVGERMGKIIEGFDYGNEVRIIKKENLNNKEIVLCTTNGSRGVELAKDADEILLGSFVCIEAIKKYIEQKKPEIVSIVAIGEKRGSEFIKAQEDEECAIALKNILEGKGINLDKIYEKIKKGPSAKRFYDQTKPQFPLEDMSLCLNKKQFNFIMKIKKENNYHIAEKIIQEV